MARSVRGPVAFDRGDPRLGKGPRRARAASYRRAIHIDRVGALSRREFFDGYVKPSRPVILVKQLEGSSARLAWSWDWFREKHGTVLVPVRFEDGRSSRMALADYIDIVIRDASRSAYCGNFDLSRFIPSLANDVSFPYVSRPQPRHEHQLPAFNHWLGPARTVTETHCDHPRNWNAQLVGKKRFELWRPATPFSIAKRNDYTTLAVSDRSRRPDAEIELNAGEMLYLPPGWWHRVTALTPSISVNRWWWTQAMARRYMGRAERGLASPSAMRPWPLGREHRELLGLLGNVPTAAPILRLARACSPRGDALKMAKRWAFDLARHQLFGPESTDVVDDIHRFLEGAPEPAAFKERSGLWLTILGQTTLQARSTRLD